MVRLCQCRRRSAASARDRLGQVLSLLETRVGSQRLQTSGYAKGMTDYKLVCEVRYELDPDRLDEFADYARTWISLIRRHGGVHYGFFMPREAPAQSPMSFVGLGGTALSNEAIALFAFPDDDAYRRYRANVATDPEGIEANTRFAAPPFRSYRRCFLEPASE